VIVQAVGANPDDREQVQTRTYEDSLDTDRNFKEFYAQAARRDAGSAAQNL
jgi:hypothetical protein